MKAARPWPLVNVCNVASILRSIYVSFFCLSVLQPMDV